MLLFFLLCLPVIILIFFELKNYRFKKSVNQFPGPPSLPLIGNAHQMGKNPSEIFLNLFENWFKFGYKNYRLWIGPNAFVVISEPKDVEFILTSNTLIDKSSVYNLLHPWLGTGLLTATGTKWFKHRKMITPSFHFKILQHFHDIMNINSNKFIEKLRIASAGETIFDFQEMTHYFTLDVICDTAMGVNINAMDNNDAEIVKAFKDMCYNINMRAFHPIKQFDGLYRFFVPEYLEYCKTLKILQDFTYDVIKKRIAARANEGNEPQQQQQEEEDSDVFTKRRMAFLDTLLTSTIDNRPLTLEEVYEEVSTFMFEGHDTTTSGVAFAIYMLSRHPDIQKKVYEEQKRIFGAHDMKRDATFQEIADMQYLDLTIKEAQRLYPSVPAIGRQVDREYNMNGKTVLPGCTLSVFLMALGYNEETFPDPYRCNPERFEKSEQGDKFNPFAYVPFSAGPRNCIGQKFALLELKTVVSKIVRNFEILPPLDELVSKDGYVENFHGLSDTEQKRRRPIPNKYDPILSTVLTLKSENGIHLRLRERK